jgi:hypothetical protein
VVSHEEVLEWWQTREQQRQLAHLKQEKEQEDGKKGACGGGACGGGVGGERESGGAKSGSGNDVGPRKGRQKSNKKMSDPREAILCRSFCELPARGWEGGGGAY